MLVGEERHAFEHEIDSDLAVGPFKKLSKQWLYKSFWSKQDQKEHLDSEQALLPNSVFISVIRFGRVAKTEQGDEIERGAHIKGADRPRFSPLCEMAFAALSVRRWYVALLANADRRGKNMQTKRLRSNHCSDWLLLGDFKINKLQTAP